MEHEGQLAFDFEEFEREDARAKLHEWAGAPLRFTTDYYPPVMLEEAFAHWRFLNGGSGSSGRSHMWHRSIAHDPVGFGEHRAEAFSADLRPDPGELGPGDLLTMIVCEPCEWHSPPGDENAAVEAWHDHAVPGWRELPVMPSQVRVRSETRLTKVAVTWIEQRYPQHMQVPGAPIITERGPYGTRHVPGYSPWGGYDLSATALDRSSQKPAGRVVRREAARCDGLGHPVSPSHRGRGLSD